ncbi:MAG: hypothetical protein HYW49_04875 [Deltaproteobacteria bacterium]|nr:hypothetical protein [Deltaproteobacteria bacterium]
MKKPSQRFLILIVAVALAAVLFFWKKAGPRSTPLSVSVGESGRQSPSAKGSTFHELYRKPRKDGVFSAAASADPCAPLLGTLMELDFDALEFPPKIERLPSIPEGCQTAETGWLRQYREKCSKTFDRIDVPPSKEEWDKQMDACLAAVFFARAGATKKMIQVQGKKLSDISDLRILADLMASEFADAVNSNVEAPFSRVDEVAERMLELDPHLYGAAKVSLTVKTVLALSGLQNGKVADWDAVMRAADRARGLDPDDRDLDELELFSRSKGLDPKRIRDSAEELVRLHPESGMGEYYLSYTEWKDGNRQGAIDDLNTAIAKNSAETKYRETLTEISNPRNKTGEDAHYKFSFNFKFTSKDFLGR